MMSRYARLATAPIPQSEPLNERQVQNNASGFVFAVDDFKRLDRFLILGSDSPTYYQNAKTLTRENAKCVERCYALDAERTVAVIVNISDSGRAPKNDPAIFALALGAVHTDVNVRRLALNALPLVCRTSTHLFQFVDTVRALKRGWGRTLKRAVARWYESKSADKLAYQAIKYRARENYTHKRMLQSAHPKSDGTPEKAALYNWICGKDFDPLIVPGILQAHRYAMQTNDESELLAVIREYNLPWEAIPTEATTNPKVWSAMLPNLGLTALIRNLGKMTSIGALKPLSDDTALVVNRLSLGEEIRKSRIHPFNVLQALAVYRSGHGVKGALKWEPVPTILDALDSAFYLAFQNVEPTGKRTLIGLDVSGSMCSPFMGSSLTVAEASAAMAMVTMRTESNWHVLGFDHGMRDLGIMAKMSLGEVTQRTSNINGGGTDCALPMLYALQRGLKVDVFQIQTDNETWAGNVHPVAALQDYRNKTGINAKLVVIGFTSTNFSIADPADAGMLDCVGFDASAPAVIADFVRG
jgi:60 kDa SS-A/Ro ribonucleoprotein